MFRPALALALPVLGLAWILASTDAAQRTAFVVALRQTLLPERLTASAPAPTVAPTLAIHQTLGPDSFAVDADRQGQFETTMLVAGRQLPVLIDTGATFVALTYDDAASVGIHPADAEFKYEVRTANGTGRVAAAILPSIRVGNVEARNVKALVSAPGTLTGQSLLGMSFLKQLSGFEIQAGRLVLRQ